MPETGKITAPPLTPEGLYIQEKRWWDWHLREVELDRMIAESLRRSKEARERPLRG